MPIGITGSIWITGSLYVNGVKMDSVSSSYAITSSYAENAVITGSNGVTYTASVLELGGELYRNTYITGTLDGLADFFMPVGAGFTSGSGPASIGSVARDQNGKFLVTGTFNGYYGVDLTNFSKGFVRLNEDLTLDTSFSAGTGFKTGSRDISIGLSESIKVDKNTGKIYVCGTFDEYSGSYTGLKRLIRLNANGSIDDTFNLGSGFSGVYQTNAGTFLNGIELDLNGKLYAVGNFTQYSGSSVGPCIVRINQDGTIDSGFDNNVGNLLPGYFGTQLHRLKIEPGTNKVYISGWLTAYKGTSGLSGLVKVNPDGTVDNTFSASPGLGAPIYSISYPTGYITAQGKESIIIDKKLNVYLVGFFRSWKGVIVNGIVKIDSSGSIDTNFNFGNGLSRLLTGTNNTLGLGSSGYIDDYDRLHLYGFFTEYSGSTVSGSFRALPNGTIDPDYPVSSLKRYNTSSGQFSVSGPVSVWISDNKKFLYNFAGYNWQNGVFYLDRSSGSNANPVKINIVDPEISFKTGGFSYDSDYSEFYTTRSLIDKGYADDRFTGSLYLTGSLYVSGTVNFSNLFSLVSQDPLPTNLPTASIASSGSGADNKPYYWNGSTWTSMIP